MNRVLLNIEQAQNPWDTSRSMAAILPRRMEAPKLRVAAYARVSSDSSDQLNSYLSQVRHYTQVIRENEEWAFVDIYADEGLSGLSVEKRPDFQRLLKDCRAGKIDRILCKSLSRFARNFTDCIIAIRELQMLRVSVLFEKENIDTTNRGDELMLSLQSLWAQRESISISGNMRRGVRMRMKTGTFLPSTTPYGYTLDLEARTLAVDEEQAAVVRRIFAAYLSGQGMQDIAEGLNRDGVPKRHGKDRWYPTTIFYILTNLSYTGDTIWQKNYTTDTIPFQSVRNRGERPRYHVQNNHPAIISQEDFARVQELITRRREKHAPQGYRDHPLSKLVICGTCGSIHRRKLTSGKAYWVCRRHDYSKENCPAPQVPEDELYRAALRMYRKLRHHRQEIIGSMLEQFRLLADRRYRHNDRLSQVNQELIDLSGQAHVLQRLNTKGNIDPALYVSQTKDINDRIAELRLLKASLMQQEKTGSVASKLEILLDTLESGPEWPEEWDDALLSELVEGITVLSPEQIKIRLTCGLELTENIERTVR